MSLSRRALVASAVGLSLVPSVLTAQEATLQWQLPMGLPDRVPGDGVVVHHAFSCENTDFNPGDWHTGEDYYLTEGDSAGAEVYAVADGEIVFAGYDYPGPVVIVQHSPDLFSMYGHLDYDLPQTEGDVTRGQLLGTVLQRTDGRAESHLHFEIRQFLYAPDVNGPAPRYGYYCGPDCAPGPGYWPMGAEHPADMGWLYPLHAIAARIFGGEQPAEGMQVFVPERGAVTVPMFVDADRADQIGEITLEPGMRFPLLDVTANAEDMRETSSEAYRMDACVQLPDQTQPVWLPMISPSSAFTGSDGRSSTITFNLLPD